MRVFIAMLGLLAVAVCAHAETQCLTLDEAAKAALAEAMPLSTEFEYGGAIIVRDGCHTFTPPKTSGLIGDVAVRVAFSTSYTLAGIYHTHPANSPLDHVFSPADVRTQRALQVPSYIGVVSTGMVKVLKDIERNISKGSRRIETADGKELGIVNAGARI